ncbi:MAG: hypothetical protein IPK07_00820 [Deltaproteobacteria bacterium]|nr:hypothetical protein [Deltaproteobacteria bacterium]
MASIEKAREYLRESDSHAHYSSIVEFALTYFIAKARSEGKETFAQELEQAKAEYHEHFAEAIGITEYVHVETFTDEELDNLIVLHQNPALKKARTLTAETMNRILQKFFEASV